jgi:fucose permease
MARPDYRVVAVAYVSFIILGLPGAIIGPLWTPHLQTEFNQPLDALGWILVTVTSGYFLGSTLSPRLFRWLSVAGGLAASTFLTAAGMLGYVLSPEWWVMAGFGLVVGLGVGVLDGGMNIYFAAHFDARLMNWLHAAFGMGALLAPQLVNLIVIRGGESWRMVYVVLLLLNVALGIVFVFTRARWLPVQDSTAQGHAPLRATARLGIVWLGVAIFAAYAGLEATAGNWGSAFFQARGVAQATANNWVTAYWLSFTIGRIVFGVFVTRFDASVVIRWCMVGAVVGALLLWWNPLPAADLIGIVVFGFMLAPIFALMVTATQERLGPAHAPNAIGIQVATASIGAGLLPAAIGLLIARFGQVILPPALVVLLVGMLALYLWSLSPSFVLPERQAAAAKGFVPLRMREE